MSKFEYRFQSIEEVKEQIKKNTEKEYAVVLMKIKDKENEIDAVQRDIDASYLEFKKLSPKEMVFLEKYRNSLKVKKSKKEKELSDLEIQRKKKRGELTQHYKDHKVFVKLKEKQFNDYLEMQKKSEQKSIDEIANQKYNTKEK